MFKKRILRFILDQRTVEEEEKDTKVNKGKKLTKLKYPKWVYDEDEEA